MVSGISLVCMVIEAVVVFGLPIAGIILARRRFHIQMKAVGIGALVFFVFVLGLEQTVHDVVLTNFPQLLSTPLAFMLYGALAAGVFEEIGRTCGFVVLRRMRDAERGLPSAIGYGLGHGGAEAILIAGLAVISNMLVAFALNGAGGVDAMVATAPEVSRELLASQLNALVDTSPFIFLLAALERAVALALQVGLSLLVWMAVSGVLRKAWILGAVLLHALADCGAGLYQMGVLPLAVCELWAVLVTVVVVALAYHLYRTHTRPQALPADGSGR